MNHTNIYSKSGDLGAFFSFQVPLKKLTDITVIDKPLAFYYEFRDCSHYGIRLEDSLDNIHWHNLQIYKDSIFIYSNCNEPTNAKELASTFATLILQHKINQEQFYVIVADEIQELRLKTEFARMNLTKINTDYMCRSIIDTSVPSTVIDKPNKKFSIMSRRYVKDRLFLFCELIKNNLLKDCYYSFHNVNPYSKQVIATIEEIKQCLPVEYQTTEILSWVENIPYYIENSYDDYTYQYSDKIYNTLLNSCFHIVIETIFDEGIYNCNSTNIVPWITEKTYKTIACKRIFLCYGMPGTLSTLKEMGFKTFDSIIDESYDSIEDPVARRNSLIQEIKKISMLQDHEILNILQNVKNITDHNLELLKEKQHKEWNKNFQDLNLFT